MKKKFRFSLSKLLTLFVLLAVISSFVVPSFAATDAMGPRYYEFTFTTSNRLHHTQTKIVETPGGNHAFVTVDCCEYPTTYVLCKQNLQGTYDPGDDLFVSNARTSPGTPEYDYYMSFTYLDEEYTYTYNEYYMVAIPRDVYHPDSYLHFGMWEV